jgi:hypothetical protein
MGLRLYAWYLASFLGPLALRICARPFAVPPPESAARRFPLLGRGVETRGRAS